ncbi:acyl carrier protein [Streptomyces sp. TX20-6-3]|uniref:acyl carrier protein n=1 Tax=Streptomyces sp. TX20-6-3 TaxID=3028705 RepID=UPI0029BF4932|nr:acyl carrier protein [Streptomyces sp. TX20-6-3]MDX2565287.1 acyl carrier protein [Streptomyces sp. TX20-6-3]
MNENQSEVTDERETAPAVLRNAASQNCSCPPEPLLPEQQSDVTQCLLGLVADVLGHGDPLQVDPEKSLIELGVDSLGGIQLFELVAARLSVRLPEEMLFERTTVSDMASLIIAVGRPTAPGYPRGDVDGLR